MVQIPPPVPPKVPLQKRLREAQLSLYSLICDVESYYRRELRRSVPPELTRLKLSSEMLRKVADVIQLHEEGKSK